MNKSEWMGKNPDWKTRYDKYIGSAKWKKLCKQFLKDAKHTCFMCGYYATEVHHETYERFGNEWPSGLRAVCKICHPKADAARKAKQEAAFEAYCEERLDDAQYQGWLNKVYGEDSMSSSETYEEFQEWRAKKDEDEYYGG